jgi:hypothetical protein
MKPIAFPFPISKTSPSFAPQRQGHTREVLERLEKDVLEITQHQGNLTFEVQEANTEKLKIILEQVKQYCGDLFNLTQLGTRRAFTQAEIRTSVDDDKKISFEALLKDPSQPALQELFLRYDSLLTTIESKIES